MWIWSHSMKNFLMENFTFCVQCHEVKKQDKTKLTKNKAETTKTTTKRRNKKKQTLRQK